MYVCQSVCIVVSLRMIFFSPQRSLTVVQYLHGNMKTYYGARLEEEMCSWCSMQSLWVIHSLLEVVSPWLWHDWKNCLSTSSASQNEDRQLELFEATMEPYLMEFIGSSFSEKGESVLKPSFLIMDLPYSPYKIGELLFVVWNNYCTSSL